MANKTDKVSDTPADDWGEAFEAEDFMFAPEADSNDDFFLDDDTIKGSDLPLEETPTNQDDNSTDKSTSANKLTNKITSFKERFSAASLPIKAAALTVCLLILVSILFISFNSTEVPLPESTENSVTKDTENAKIDLPDTIDKQAEPPGSAQPMPQEKDPYIEARADTPPKQIRKKWKLPAMMIAAKADNEQEKVLSIDLTLILLLDQGTHPPEDQEIHARELIYQFFNNRPFSELERYSLARGEMIRNLRAWIEKQWPDLPLNAIVFDNYQIL